MKKVLLLLLYGVVGNAVADVISLLFTGGPAPNGAALLCGVIAVYVMWPVVMRWERQDSR